MTESTFSRGETDSGDEGRTIAKVADMIEHVKNIHDEKRHEENVHDEESSQEYEWYYRGELCEEWSLGPSIDRRSYSGEGKMLTDLRARHPDKFLKYPSAFSHWVLAQHYKLPTRLLDVTKNPLVALFFACQDKKQCRSEKCCEVPDPRGRIRVFCIPKDVVKSFNSDSVSIVANFARLSKSDQVKMLMAIEEEAEVGEVSETPNLTIVQKRGERFLDRIYGYIREEKPGFQAKMDPKDLFKMFAVDPEQSFDRIRVQSGAFLISALGFQFRESSKHISNEGYNLYKIYIGDMHIEGEKKESILKELELLGITRETLFPGLEESSIAIAGKYVVDTTFR